ncbi:integrin beta-1-like isoform X2 [Apostichopus japonicus]|uniref:integrin beta-1-like isoform X2 n=1 Tax=Stichopus japonicus TaxID=307972 RepID=UPI003AB904AE
MESFIKVLITAFIMSCVLSKEASCESIPECHPAKTCGNCMRINPQCSWCSDVNFTSDVSRCDSKSFLKQSNCNKTIGRPSSIDYIENAALQDPVYENDDDEEPIEQAVPIQPQEVKIVLRPGDTQTIRVGVRQVNDYPVDLYYLMDLSHSMKDDLKNLHTLGSLLATEMKKITRSFTLGFGSFVDKPVAPYSAAEIIQSGNPPCTGCAPAYGFRNELPLNRNTTLFDQKVKSTLISSNQDDAEGTLDAIAQAALCTEDIGWRNESRRLLLVTSDDTFHIEGDGKMAGILRPFDGRCHLVNNEYAKTKYYDYPSIGQVNDVLVSNNIISIFATSGLEALYRNLSIALQGSTFSQLRSDSTNIVQIVSSKYREITESIQISDTSPEGTELRYRVNCSGEARWLQPGEKPECGRIHAGDQISLEVEVKATKCINQRFEIYPIGFERHLQVHVEVICNCSCESEPDVNTTECTGGNGNRDCGVCQCLPGYYGDQCECTAENEENQDHKLNDLKCKPDNDTTVLCSGRGECICGECRCNQPANAGVIISGTYCECNNQGCDLANGEVCGGPERGECVCALDGRTNECQCRPGYTGDKCDCPTQTESCRANNGLICNAIGECKCGKCICEKSPKFTGPRCDECVSCDVCDLHTNCVLCKLLNDTEILSKEDCDMCSQVIQYVPEFPELDGNEKTCNFPDAEECTVHFQFADVNGTMHIYVKSAKDCAHSNLIIEGVELQFVILYIVLGIILFGLLLIFIYRLYTWHLDRKEYQQFVAEKEKAQWDKNVNPIYSSGTRKYVNPMYGH